MKKFFCFGKKDFCDENASCNGCPFEDGSGGEYREEHITNGDHIRSMTDEEMATELLPLFEELCEDGIPSPEYMRFWLKRPYRRNDDG